MERIHIGIERWVPNPDQSYGDGSMNHSGVAIAQDNVKYEYTIRVAKDGTVVTNQSAVTGITLS